MTANWPISCGRLPPASRSKWVGGRRLRLGSSISFVGGHLDFDLNAGIDQTGREHGRRGPDLAKITAQDGPARFEILHSGKDVLNPHNVGNPAPGLRQSLF